jgi:hypothetical protein
MFVLHNSNTVYRFITPSEETGSGCDKSAKDINLEFLLKMELLIEE